MVVIKKQPKKVMGKFIIVWLTFGCLWFAFSVAFMIFDGFGMTEEDHPFFPSEDTFSACIFVKDQNHELVEWIAYYYQTFSLEYLVIGFDKESTTTPNHVVDRWKSKIKTVIWSQNMFAPDEKMPDGIGNMNARHSRKEKLFFKECIKHLKFEGRKWTLFVEPNEFITFRYPSMSTTPDDLKKDYQHILIPKMRERGVIRKFLAQEASKGGILSHPCITIPRLLFIGKETSFLDPMNLNTLRYSAHGKRDVIVNNGLAKHILDVSRVTLESLDKIRNANSMIKGVCEDPQLLMIDSLFQINRYIGSYEAYHRSREIQSGGGAGGQEAYDQFAKLEDRIDDNIRTWFEGFVASEHDAIDLIGQAGTLDLPLV